MARRVIVKVGTNVLGGPGTALGEDRIASLTGQIAALMREGRQVALVTSGAIGCGMAELGLKRRPATLPMSQAAASVGQGVLMAHYERHFRRHGLHAAQILLTHDDFDSRERYLNACNTIHALFELPCVPVVNENDTISTAEIQFGENDRLAALLTHLIRAELLVLLTSAPGLCLEPPGAGRPADVLEVVERVDDRVRGLVFDEKTALGVGGMRSKIEAARVTTEAGEAAVIADGRLPDVLPRLMSGERLGTLFLPAPDRLSSRKRWLRFTSRPRGTVHVDAGAQAALAARGKSLLPSGVTAVEGEFTRGDVVRIKGPTGGEIARGLCNYSRDEIERIRGCHTSRIEKILGYKHYDEVVHRDNMALLS
ncbi:MAG: glutamate 5-kinase [Candidatus Brocadiaceae bacterium]|nr:glutamate 5-kinase [Candidatus Brocadiaceae bacterium]